MGNPHVHKHCSTPIQHSTLHARFTMLTSWVMLDLSAAKYKFSGKAAVVFTNYATLITNQQRYQICLNSANS